jgi:hypothetical protein
MDRVYEETGVKCVFDSAFVSCYFEFLGKSLQNDITADSHIANISVKRESISIHLLGGE